MFTVTITVKDYENSMEIKPKNILMIISCMMSGGMQKG